MRRLSLLLVTLLLIPCAAPAVAQNADADSLLLRGKRIVQDAHNHGDVDRLKEARALFERVTADPNRRALAHYYVGLANYRLIPLVEEENREAYIDNGVEHLDRAIELDEDMAEAYALLGSTYGQKLGLKPLLAMFLGPKAQNLLNEAKSLEPDNPRVVLLDAMNTYFKPGFFGGSEERGLEGFERAAALFDQQTPDSATVQPTWGHADAYAWIGRAYMEREAPAQARAAFEKALAIEPEFGWVEHVMLPQVAERDE